MSTNERGQRQTENMSPGMSGTPGMHGTLQRNNVHEDDLTHQEYGGKKKKTGTLMISPQTQQTVFTPEKVCIHLFCISRN